MTPEREAYLEKCSYKERTLRALINDEKCAIKVLKNNFKYPQDYNFNVLLIMISQCKLRLSAYRHELHRLKGMDRVAVPRRPILARWSGIWLGYCKCKGSVKSLGVYCPHCGRRILWEKVK